MSSPMCVGCGVPTEPGWQFCPLCGRSLVRNCSECGEPLAPRWKLCPMCGASATSDPALTAAAVLSSNQLERREQGWSLYQRLLDVFTAPVTPLREQLQQADRLSLLLAARDPDRFKPACSAGITALVQLQYDESLPEPVRKALARLESHRGDLLAQLEPTLDAVRHSARDVAGLNLPEGGGEKILSGVGSFSDPTSRTGLGALGGATIGSFLFPGVGTLIGGAIGAFWGHSHTTTKQQAILEKYDRAFADVFPALLAVFGRAWDRSVDHIVERNSLKFDRHQFFRAAEEEWLKLRDAYQPGEAAHAAIMNYMDRWGPCPEALHFAAVNCLFLGGEERQTEARTWSEMQVRLFPHRADTFLTGVELALDQRDWSGAVHTATQGWERYPTDVRLRLAQIESLSAAGRTRDAEAVVQELKEIPTPLDPWLILVRGKHRLGDSIETGLALRTWLGEVACPARVARIVREDVRLGSHFAEIASGVPELVPFTEGLERELPAIVRSYLKANGTTTFHGKPTAEKLRGAEESFLKLEPKEEVLYFFDWSFWGTAKSGLAITDRRVLWIYTGVELVSIPLRGLDPNKVEFDGNILTVGDHTVSLDDRDLGMALREALAEIASAVNRK